MTSDEETGPRIAAAAAALVGTRFRLHGRDPATGLDCLGLVAVAAADAGIVADPPTGYRLRNRAWPDLGARARAWGLAEAAGPDAPGDIIAAEPAPFQLHLLVALAADRFVHAHAGLGRVVELAGELPWRRLGHWRAITPD